MNKTKIYENGDSKQRYQGDIGILMVSEPKGLIFSAFPVDGRLIVGHSETGHHHTVVKDREAELEIAKDEHGYFLRVNSGAASVVHEKQGGHETQTLGVGVYFIGHQYEYDEREDRKVID